MSDFIVAMRVRAGSLICCVLTVMLTGCTVDSYKKPIDDFATATAKAADAYATLQTSMVDARIERQKVKLLDPKRKPALSLNIKTDDCDSASARCRLEIGTPGGKQVLLVPELVGISTLLRGVADYAKNLQAVIGADTTAQVDASLAAAAGSAKNLAGSVLQIETAKAGGVDKVPDGIKQLGDAVTAYATPVGNLVSWVVGEYVAHRQVAALRIATTQARPIIKQAGRVLSVAGATLARESKQDAFDAISAAQDAFFRARRDRGALDRFVSAAAADDQVLVATGSDIFGAPDIFGAMVKAHDDLAGQLAGENVTLADVAAATQAFNAQANALQKMLADIQAAHDKLQIAKKAVAQ